MPFSFNPEQKQTAIWLAAGLAPGFPPMKRASVLTLPASAILAMAISLMRTSIINSSSYCQP